MNSNWSKRLRSEKVITPIFFVIIRFWPRLCKNVFERDRSSLPDWKSLIYAKSTSADMPINVRARRDLSFFPLGG